MIAVTLILFILEIIAYLIPTKKEKIKYRSYLHLILGRMMLFILGFYSITHYGTDLVKIKAGQILISNHSSWIDILYFWTFYSPLFVSGNDGKFCTESTLEILSRTFKIEVAKGSESLDEIIKKAEALYCPIVIFPEGSTTNGRALLKFNVFTKLPARTFLFGLLYAKSDFSPSFSVGSGFKHFYNLSSQLENKLLVKTSAYQKIGNDVNSDVLKGLSSLTKQRITNFTVHDKLDFNNFYKRKKSR